VATASSVRCRPKLLETGIPGRFERWRTLTIALLVTGYAGYYLCRSDLAVAFPLLIVELGKNGVPPDLARIRLGAIASMGVIAYAVGKLPSGWLADFLGGRRNFLFGMAGSVLFTVLFGLAGVPLFTLVWMGNRLVQSLGWAGMVKITSRWFSYSSYGTVMGVVSLSFLFGDAASREFMSWLIDAGISWRGLFYAAGATLGLLLLVNLLLLKETPERIGCPEPPPNPGNLFESAGNRSTPERLSSLLQVFTRSRVFWLVCLLSCGITVLRETFNLWTPTYFTQAVGLTVADAAHKSALFPLFGGISVLLAGLLSDRLGKCGRAAIISVGMMVAAAALMALAYADRGGSKTLPVVLVALVGFAMTGPYSYLAGAISLDFGGKQGSATASGLIDCAGYLGGALAGNSFAGVSVKWGWKGGFASLAVVAVLSGVAAVAYLNHQRRTV
jgi:OPA family glycerol-3-phosphate transporter-like MFS transporter